MEDSHNTQLKNEAPEDADSPTVLSAKARQAIKRRVWLIWAVRQSALCAGMVLVVVWLNTHASLYHVFENALSAWERGLGGFLGFWVSAFASAELSVIAGVLIVAIGTGLLLHSVGRVMGLAHKYH